VNNTLRGSTSLELIITARTDCTGEFELSLVSVYEPKAAGAGMYTGEHHLSAADSQAVWQALPDSVQALLLQRCAEEAEPDNDEDPPSREEICDERGADDVYQGAE
jgi:hypothetical protein